ncbi:PREDICTED: dihomomethionine N-hydroxylase-like isoform X1 [Tarenaya hassleriana]|uniref:dihomomethionine N-hydroxylase-like isoform X2 n=1 Tax=Tarenaya hassleriana TaxID=28532 RepID=UPI00053CA6B1|nr:PREDICTED: dihomomethionine N-hydroxylase-like isoform X2 [Tarenaya hassleriana]XP_019057947.1 PREDICTED: dihomomethionine N-hydroxylase-like isoform X1 [Tarenaya hassleriana]
MSPNNVTTSLEFSAQPLPLIFLTLVISVTAILFFVRSTKSSKGRELPPGPRAWPIIGNLGGMIMNRPVFRWINRVMNELQTEIACFRFGNIHVITISSDEIAREALKEKDSVLTDRPESYSTSAICSGLKTLVFSNYGDQWVKMRRVMTSELMSPGRLNWLLDARTVESDNLLAYVHNLYKRSKTVNVREIGRTYAYTVMMRMMFGRRCLTEVSTEDGSLGPMEREHVDAIFKSLDCFFSFQVSDFIPCLRGWGLDRHEKKAREACDTIARCNALVIDDRIKLWREREGKKDVEDWLDVLISLKDSEGKPLLTPQEIKGECKDVCVASLDNPANNVEWTLAEMLNRPETLKRAMDELDRVVGKDRLVQESDIPNLNYIKSCCRESYRLHTVAPFLPPHVTTEDTSLGGFFVPKGSHVLVNRVLLGQNPKIWVDPEVFKPERHISGDGCSEEVSLMEPEMRFVSFSTGRRGCIGGKVGTYMTVMLLARLLQGFTWKLPPGSGPVQVELVESPTSLLMAKPLVLSVEPRLAPHMYPQFRN